MSHSFIFSGTEESWRFSFSQPILIWGFTHGLRSIFKNMRSYDLAFFHVNGLDRIVGYGLIRDTYEDHRTPLW
ncbi:MAG: hypothetical protein N2510_05225, partial [Ignavibacteria bacterium]|nr:hypothetical protein [Ignavibacteria bacterium]